MPRRKREDQPEEPTPQPEPKRFPTVKVSAYTHIAIKDFEAALMKLGSARTNDEVHECYPEVCRAREALYGYISDVEKATRMIEQPITLRFF